MIFTEKECDKHLSRYVNVSTLTPFSFQPWFYCTRAFDTWFRAYYNKDMFNVDAFSQHLTIAFASIQERFEKVRSFPIKEIQAFHKYFKTIYRPDDLSRTICEDAHTLKEKILKKLPDLKIPSYVK